MSTQEEHKLQNDSFTEASKNRFLILHNDDVHTFDYVIDALIDICEHNTLQAEQCTMIIHFKGKCSIKGGTFDKLKPMKEKFIKKELNVTIE